MKFKKGDKVIDISTYADGKFNGDRGIIVRQGNEKNHWLVEWTSGHYAGDCLEQETHNLQLDNTDLIKEWMGVKDET